MASQEQYPSFEALDETKSVKASTEFRRLRWFLKGPITKSIHVLKDGANPSLGQDAYQADGGVHSISAKSITEPPVSSIVMSIDALDEWASAWDDMNDDGADEDDDDENDEDDEDNDRGERPPPGPKLTIKAEPGQFVSIGKFVELVHPWLLSLEGQIRAAMGVGEMKPIPKSADVAMLCSAPNPIFFISNHDLPQAVFEQDLNEASTGTR